MGSLITGVLEQGMIYAIMSLGVYITYRILDFPDLTVDGSFPLGGSRYCCFDYERGQSLCNVVHSNAGWSNIRSCDRGYPCKI